MRTFLKKVLLHISIPALLLGYLLYIGYIHNLHLTTFPNQRIIIGEPYNENYAKWYKWQRNLNNVNLICIGSSRVLQFKSEFFSDSFFNLGYMVGTPEQTLDLIKSKKIKNKTIIVSLDQWAFNSEWLSEQGEFNKPSKPNFLESSISAGRLNDVIKFKISPVLNSTKSPVLKIGAGANISLDGITNDGSYYYGKIYQGLLTKDKDLIGEDYQFANTIDRIKKGDRRFEHGQLCDQKALYEFEKLVKYNLKQGNKVFYFFPPFAPTIQHLIRGNNYNYISDASTKISQIAKVNHVSFFDYTFFQSTDQMYIDGFHGGARVYYNIAKSMGLKTKDCIFINHFETINDTDLYTERKKFFTSSKSNQTPFSN